MNIDQAIITTLRQQAETKRALLINPRTKEFISFEDGLITCPLNVSQGTIQPSLIIDRYKSNGELNDIALKMCDEFQQRATYTSENGPSGSLEYGFADNAKQIICRITDFVGQGLPDMKRMVQFHQNNEDELQPAQWLCLDTYRKYATENAIKVKPPTKTFWFWFNLEPNGFVVSISNPKDRSIIFTLDQDGFFGEIPTGKKSSFHQVSLGWPDLELKKSPRVHSPVLMDLFPNLVPGVIRVTQIHATNELKCYQTHIACC